MLELLCSAQKTYNGTICFLFFSYVAWSDCLCKRYPHCPSANNISWKASRKKVLEMLWKNSITGFLIGLIIILKQWTHRKWVLQKIFSDSFFHIILNCGLNPKTLCCVYTLSRWHWFKSFTKKEQKLWTFWTVKFIMRKRPQCNGPGAVSRSNIKWGAISLCQVWQSKWYVHTPFHRS